MIRKIYRKIRKSWFNELNEKVDSLQSQITATIAITANCAEMELAKRLKEPIRLEQYGYKVYSQNDEDGILSEIFKRIGTMNKKFIEFGVQNGLESIGHFLLHKGWQGLWLEGSLNYCKQIYDNFKEPITNRQLNVVNAFINKNNINDLIAKKGGINGEIDLLSVDIDGNDYHIWKAIDCVNPRVVCIEYNAKFPPNFEWIMKYDENHIWDGISDKSGASLKSLEILGNELGYQLVGTNLNGVNAFFVRKELTKDLFVQPATAENLYNPPRYCYGFNYRSGAHSLCYIGKIYKDR
jgi:hypothetical protein